ncbi:MAG: hypothetical protein IT466_02765 [Moraxellaceae bacterium]|jgi:hypothetical protein|nr:hypothetical protein [Moraxellaceae bacterium]
MTKKTMHPKASALLDAHVAYITTQLSGKTLQPLVADEIRQIMVDAKNITLNEAVTPQMIKDTARNYAVDLELSGAIPELVGDIARTLYANPIHDLTTIGELLPDGLFEEFLDKVLEMREAREYIMHEAIANPVYSALASDILLEGIRGYVQQGRDLARHIPGAARAARLGQSLLSSAFPLLEETLEENSRKYVIRILDAVLQRSEHFLLNNFDEDRLREIALEVWDIVKEKPVSTFKHGFSSLDMEEFFVISYETWRELRTTVFYQAMIDTGIDCFFEKYGETNLCEIVDEMGITQEIMVGEAMRYVPPIIKMLKSKKLLEPVLRRNLEAFYGSKAVLAILDTP